uniref:Putative product n=1 Tax=Xenopsylla cheopis TaxID=163159 RepID=A0A6M2DWC9_XENCH
MLVFLMTICVISVMALVLDIVVEMLLKTIMVIQEHSVVWLKVEAMLHLSNIQRYQRIREANVGNGGLEILSMMTFNYFALMAPEPA